MLRTEENKEQFMERYQLANEKFPKIFENKMIALPCDCEDGGGQTHWAALSRTDLAMIKHHLEFCAPEGTPWPDGIPEYDETVNLSD